MFGFVVSLIIALLYSICMWCYWDTLDEAVNVVNASTDFLAANYRIIFTSMFHFLLTFMVVLQWVAVMAAVVSMNEVVANPNLP